MGETGMLIVFKALSDPTRLRIIRLLLERNLCVCELMFILGMAQSRVSHQLRILRDSGLVEVTREGQWIIYRLPLRIKAKVAPLFDLFPGKAGTPGSSDLNRLKLCLLKKIRKNRLSGRRRAGS
jgi:ArsR family transcriptional regulator